MVIAELQKAIQDQTKVQTRQDQILIPTKGQVIAVQAVVVLQDPLEQVDLAVLDIIDHLEVVQAEVVEEVLAVDQEVVLVAEVVEGN